METRLVKWVDSQVSGGWRTKEEYLEQVAPKPITSIGFVLEDNAEYLVLIQSVGDPWVADSITIPRGCILETKEVFNFG